MKIKYKLNESAVDEGVVDNIKNWFGKVFKKKKEQTPTELAYSDIVQYLPSLSRDRQKIAALKNDLREKIPQILELDKNPQLKQKGLAELDNLLKKDFKNANEFSASLKAMKLDDKKIKQVEDLIAKGIQRTVKTDASTQASSANVAPASQNPPLPPSAAFEKTLVSKNDTQHLEDLTNYYSTNLKDIPPESVKKILSALILNNRMISEKKIKEVKVSRGMKQDITGGYSAASKPGYGVPMQKAGIETFSGIKSDPKFVELITNVEKQTGESRENILKVIELLFKNEKLAHGGEKEKQDPRGKAIATSMASSGGLAGSSEDDEDYMPWNYMKENRKRSLNIEDKNLNRMKKLAGIKS